MRRISVHLVESDSRSLLSLSVVTRWRHRPLRISALVSAKSYAAFVLRGSGRIPAVLWPTWRPESLQCTAVLYKFLWRSIFSLKRIASSRLNPHESGLLSSWKPAFISNLKRTEDLVEWFKGVLFVKLLLDPAFRLILAIRYWAIWVLLVNSSIIT